MNVTLSPRTDEDLDDASHWYEGHRQGLGGEFLDELNRQSGEIKNVDRSSWLEQCQGWRKKYPVVLPEYWSYADGVSLYVLVHEDGFSVSHIHARCHRPTIVK